MRARLFSDLHLEFERFDPEPLGEDIVILAGDIHPGVKGLLWAREKFPDTRIVFVAGNHEFYGGRRVQHHYGKMKEKADELGIYFLQDSALMADDVLIVGATLWTDFCLDGKANQIDRACIASRMMNDYRHIKRDYDEETNPTYATPINPNDTIKMHEVSRNYIADTLRGGEHKSLVVTHHAPLRESVDGRYLGSLLNCAYASDLSDLIKEHKPTVWVHGHMHTSKDYVYGDTRVVSNPKGYYDENLHFDPNLILEI